MLKDVIIFAVQLIVVCVVYLLGLNVGYASAKDELARLRENTKFLNYIINHMSSRDFQKYLDKYESSQAKDKED